jgi:hypothetical protein
MWCPRRNARGGRSAAEHLVAALRCVYRHAEDDKLISAADNPARKVAKPRRLPSTRQAIPDTRLAEINQVAATTENDPELDTLLLRLHTETACRRGGALAVRPDDLDRDQCLILLAAGIRRSHSPRTRMPATTDGTRRSGFADRRAASWPLTWHLRPPAHGRRLFALRVSGWPSCCAVCNCGTMAPRRCGVQVREGRRRAAGGLQAAGQLAAAVEEGHDAVEGVADERTARSGIASG